MSTTDRNQGGGSKSPSNAPLADTSNNMVDLLKRDSGDASSDTKRVDETITSSSPRVTERGVEELNRKSAEIEREIETPKVRYSASSASLDPR